MFFVKQLSPIFASCPVITYSGWSGWSQTLILQVPFFLTKQKSLYPMTQIPIPCQPNLNKSLSGKKSRQRREEVIRHLQDL
jgi:hypothetical protein